MSDVEALIAQERKCADLAAYFGGTNGTRDDYDNAMEATDMALAGACATVSAPVKGGGKLADLIDDVIEEWQDNQWSDRPKESKPLADTVADAVAGFVGACPCGGG